LTANAPALYSGRMSKVSAQQAIDQDLKRLEFRVEELVRTVERMKEENRSLRVQQEHMTAERAQLIERNELARSRVEAMISRLKAMEQNA
jgi:cell division protein ZapB